MDRLVRRRGPLACVVIAVVAAVLVAAFTGPVRVSGSPRATAAADLGTTALAQLAQLHDVRLRGTLETESGVPLDVDIVTLASGDTTATVSDGAGGVATFAAVGGKVVVNGNNAWWLNTVPVYAYQIAGKWVQATENMGFPIGMLTALSGKQLGEKFAGDDWAAKPTVYVDGTPAVALSPKDSPWTIYLSTEGGTRLLGIGGPLAAAGEKLREQPGGTAQSFPTGLVSASAVDDPCKQRTDKALTDAKQQAATAPAAPPVPEANHGPAIEVTLVPTGTCMTPACPTPIEVTNSGDEPAQGTLSVTSTSGGGGDLPISVGPGQTVQQSVSVVNPASSCTETCTRSYTVTAFAQVTSVAGPDLDTGRRLHDRGVDPNRPVPGQPGLAGPDVNSVIDKLSTPGPAVAGFQANGDLLDQVIALVRDSGDGRVLSLLAVLAKNPAIAVAADQPSPVVALAQTAVRGNRVKQLGARQALSLLAQLAQDAGRQPNTLRVDHDLILDSQNKRVYSIASVTNPDNRAQRVYDAADAGIKAFTTVDTTGYAKVLVLDFGDSYPEYGQVHRKTLVDLLSKLTTGGSQRLTDLLRDPSGQPVVTELMVANKLTRESVPGGRYEFTADDLRAMVYQRAATTPTRKPTSSDLVYTQANLDHMLHGDPYDPANPGKQYPGGHLGGAGGPGKTEFPKAWTVDDIKAAIAQVVDRANTVDGQANPTAAPRADVNHMNARVWSWRFLGQATVKGITAELDLYIYDGGTFRNGYPSLRAGGPNHALTRDDVFVNHSATFDDKAIFQNPDPPATPQLNNARTFPPRYNNTNDTWEYPAATPDGRPAVDQAGTPIVYKTDNTGALTPGSPTPTPGC
ncbi:EndoU domain-containing protein [Actinokineospora inagensis]|uniref:EndoU domain-containing protein n=1 Tax=Actinokineospora inagensis TaxID=103730 RepID=UPI00041D8EE4|nr:EndoU domain-containing protein [Actinokineospora inagensis]